ncbi:MAG: glycosyltransferase family 39 protein [Nanoarchaeota archaeon]|nr:glycosyltransferase family 39 protein [Nanoarchaeota archaeon]
MVTKNTFLKKNCLLIIILSLAIVLRLSFLDTSYVFWDESIYLMGGEVLAGQPAGYNELDFRHPLLTVMITPFTFSSHYLYLSKTFMILVNTFFVFLVYVFAKQFNKQIGLLSAFLVSIWPYPLMSSSWVMTDGLAAITLLLTIIFYFKGFKQKQDELVYWGGFFLGLAVLAKFTNVLLFILLLPLFIFNLKRIKTVLKSFLIAFLTISPYLIISYLKFGNPLHGILKAFTIGNAVMSSLGPQPISMILKVFYDFFGIPLSVFLFAGLLLFIKKEILLQEDKAIRKNNFFWAYCFAIFLLYYFYTVHEGATPIWWDSQRFLLSFLPFGIIFSAYFITETIKKFSKTYKLVILALLTIMILLSWTQQYSRFAQPAISHEAGLRQVTKEMGLYLKYQDMNGLLCFGNCPPIAYYSDKKLSIIYDLKDFKLEKGQYGILFSDKLNKLSRTYDQVKSFCKQEWCVSLLKN